MQNKKNLTLAIVLAAIALVAYIIGIVLVANARTLFVVIGLVIMGGAFGCAFLLAGSKRGDAQDFATPERNVDEETGEVVINVPSFRVQDARGDKLELTPEEKEVEEDMHIALEENQFDIFYQTKVNIIKGNIVGLEALIRWEHPKKGLIPPRDFLPLAEKTGFIVNIGYWVVEQVCSHISNWRGQGYKVPQVAINLSKTELYNPDFLTNLKATIAKYNIEAGNITLEINESIIITDYIYFEKLINALIKAGFVISIDNFGSKQENFNRLEKIPCDEIKFDASFARNVLHSAESKATVVKIMELARALGIDVVCEGVETQEQVDVLLDHSCNVAQGYFFSFPTKSQDVIEYLQQ